MANLSQPYTANSILNLNLPHTLLFQLQPSVEVAIRTLRLPEIKACLKALNDQAGLRISVTGRKQELVGRLTTAFTELIRDSKSELYLVAIRSLEKVYGSEISTNPYNTNGNHAARIIGRAQPGPSAAQMPDYVANGTSSANGQAAYRPGPSLQNATAPHARTGVQTAKFLPSPYYRIDAHVGSPILCQPFGHSRHPITKIIFTLSPEQISSLRSNSDTQLRVFCTTLAASQASLSGKHLAPIEFPVVSDIRVNNTKLSVNVRGKKTPAKILPPNANKDGKLNLTTGFNEVELLYNDTRVSYVFSLAICTMTTPDVLAQKVIDEKVKSKEQVLSEMKRAAQDDEIEVGEVTITLKCPLSYMRLVNPCRSSLCAHIQCFDALSFFSVNEQTPTWECPVCFKKVDPAGLFVDGYVKDILQRVPDSEEHVNIDAEGKWRTPNNKYRSDDPEATLNNDGASLRTAPQLDAESSRDINDLPKVKGEAPPDEDLINAAQTPPLTPSMQAAASRSKRAQVEVFELDDSPSPPRTSAVTANGANVPSSSPAAQQHGEVAAPTSAVVRPASEVSAPRTAILPPPSPSMSRQVSTGRTASGVIDLTLSDSDDDDLPVHRPLPNSSMLINPSPASRSSQPPPPAHNHFNSRPVFPPPSNRHGFSAAPVPFSHHVTPPASAPAGPAPGRFPLDRFLVPLGNKNNLPQRPGLSSEETVGRATSAPRIVPLMRGISVDDPASGPSRTEPATASTSNGLSASSSSSNADHQQVSQRRSPAREDDGGDHTSRPHKRARNDQGVAERTTDVMRTSRVDGDEFDEFGELTFFDDERYWTDPSSGLTGQTVTSNGGVEATNEDVATAPVNNNATTNAASSGSAADELLLDERAGLSGSAVT